MLTSASAIMCLLTGARHGTLRVLLFPFSSSIIDSASAFVIGRILNATSLKISV